MQRIYEDLAPAVTGYLRLRGADEPEDVASETFLSVFRAIGSFSGDEDSFRSWVFTIAHRRLIDDRRSRGRRPLTTHLEDDTGDVGGDVEQEALAGLGDSWAREVLEELSSEQRDVILFRVLGELSVDEVAQIIGKRPGAVRALQHRGLLKLRSLLAERRISELAGGHDE